MAVAVKLPEAIPKPETTKWEEAFHSPVYQDISRKRTRFVVPALLAFSAMFFVFWIIQSMFPNVARYRVYGYVNVNFVYTMLIFPVVWVLGLCFVRYTRRNVYPLEEELVRKFGKGART